MVAKTDQKARLLDLVTSVLELTRDDKRDIQQVSSVFQMIKNDKDFFKKLHLTDPVFCVSVNYNNDFASILKAAGFRLGPEDLADMNRLFLKSTAPVCSGSKEVVMHILEHKNGISHKDLMNELKVKNLRPANLIELLALMENFLYYESEFSIVALGSIGIPAGSDVRCCPYVKSKGSSRFLNKVHLSDSSKNERWSPFFSFAAVRL